MKQNQPTVYPVALNQSAEAAICPHCAKSNQCAVAAGEAADNCWCMTSPINPAMVDRYAGLQRCLCPHCGRATSDESPLKGSRYE